MTTKGIKKTTNMVYLCENIPLSKLYLKNYAGTISLIQVSV